MLFLTQSYFPLPKVCTIRIERFCEYLSICFVGITWCTLWSVKTKLREFQTTHQNWTLLSFLSSDRLCPIIMFMPLCIVYLPLLMRNKLLDRTIWEFIALCAAVRGQLLIDLRDWKGWKDGWMRDFTVPWAIQEEG